MNKNICDSCLNFEGCIVPCNRKKQEMEKKQKTYVIKNDCNTQTVNTNINLCDHKVIPFNDCPHDEVELDLANKYEIVVRDGKTFIVRKKTQYPKTYEECCVLLGCKADDFFTDFSYNCCDVEISDYEDKIDDLLKSFRKLIYCRDAYWKIAGNWKPNLGEDFIYSIGTCYGSIEKRMVTGDSGILLFPTEEMRDAFFENFKDLIEECKELL